MSFDKDMLALNVVAKLNQEIERLTAELAECKKDAERYRWLRVMNAEQWDSFFGGMRRDCNRKMLDAAIDKAMQELRK